MNDDTVVEEGVEDFVTAVSRLLIKSGIMGGGGSKNVQN
jgi:hypothetical protein